MSASGAEDLEALVALFLDLRAGDPALDPQRFAEQHGCAPERAAALVAAIRRALAIAATLEAPDGALPDSIGPYRVLRELGRGGAGVVYEVERGGRRLALKRVSGAALGPRGLERFRREARLLARLEHPGVVRVADAGSESGDPWLAMELVEGAPLSALVRAGPLEPRRAARIALELARAVAAVHAAGVVHRDLKPENVILAEGDRPVLVDFGLGAAEDEATLTATGALLGTPRYMAPEQARGEPADRRTDVYALGVILWELLAGAPARPEPSRSALLRDIERRPLRAPRPAAGRVDAGLARLLAAALAHEPRARLGEAALLADDLERWLAGERVRARPPGAIARLVSFARRRPARAAGVAVLALALVALWVIVGRARSESLRKAHSARGHVDRAVAALLLGDEAFARSEAQAALRVDPRSRDARALVASAVLAADAPPVAELVADARPGLPARRPLTELAARVERLRAAGDLVEAAGVLEHFTKIAPDLAAGWRALAATRIEQGAVEAGLDAARQALLVERDPSDREGELPRLLARAPDAGAVRALLERLVRERPDDTALSFALGWTLDAAHEIEAAERAYRHAVAADPGHLRAWLCLAHLHSGAQLGVCAGCERAYGRWPELLDVERSLGALLEALAIDRGASESALGRVLETALALGRRSGSAEPLERVLAGVERCEEAPPSAQAAARLADARTRLVGALGR